MSAEPLTSDLRKASVLCPSQRGFGGGAPNKKKVGVARKLEDGHSCPSWRDERAASSETRLAEVDVEVRAASTKPTGRSAHPPTSRALPCVRLVGGRPLLAVSARRVSLLVGNATCGSRSRSESRFDQAEGQECPSPNIESAALRPTGWRTATLGRLGVTSEHPRRKRDLRKSISK